LARAIVFARDGTQSLSPSMQIFPAADTHAQVQLQQGNSNKKTAR
jgi:hypothetical protein